MVATRTGRAPKAPSIPAAAATKQHAIPLGFGVVRRIFLISLLLLSGLFVMFWNLNKGLVLSTKILYDANLDLATDVDGAIVDLDGENDVQGFSTSPNKTRSAGGVDYETKLYSNSSGSSNLTQNPTPGSTTGSQETVDNPSGINDKSILNKTDNNSIHVALIFTTGGASTNCSNETEATAKLAFLESIWDRLVASLQYTLQNRPSWRLSLRFVNDGWRCLNWTRLEQRLILYGSNTTSYTHNNTSSALQSRIQTNYVPNESGKRAGIGQNMQNSYAAIHARNDADYIVNLEDDMICRKRWLITLYEAYVVHKQPHEEVPLIASGYNSVFRRDEKHINTNCTPSCQWKAVVYGPNYFFDNATLQTVVQPAFSLHHRGFGGKRRRPKWVASLDAWDNWILEEYWTVHKSVRSDRILSGMVLVVSPSVLQHVMRRGSMHENNQDVALDFVDSADDNQEAPILRS